MDGYVAKPIHAAEFFAAIDVVLAPKAPATNRLGQVHTPTLVVMGTGDPDFKDAAAEGRWVADQVHGRLKLVPGAGHYPHVECAAQVNPTIVDFVRQTAARSHAA